MGISWQCLQYWHIIIQEMEQFTVLRKQQLHVCIPLLVKYVLVSVENVYVIKYPLNTKRQKERTFIKNLQNY